MKKAETYYVIIDFYIGLIKIIAGDALNAILKNAMVKLN